MMPPPSHVLASPFMALISLVKVAPGQVIEAGRMVALNADGLAVPASQWVLDPKWLLEKQRARDERRHRARLAKYYHVSGWLRRTCFPPSGRVFKAPSKP